MGAISSIFANGAASWLALPASCARLTSFKPCQPKRRRTRPVWMRSACTRWTGMTTSVSVVSPRLRRRPFAERVRRKFHSRKVVRITPVTIPSPTTVAIAPSRPAICPPRPSALNCSSESETTDSNRLVQNPSGRKKSNCWIAAKSTATMASENSNMPKVSTRFASMANSRRSSPAAGAASRGAASSPATTATASSRRSRTVSRRRSASASSR